MRLSEIEFVKLLPKFMQDDPANIGIAKGIDIVIKIFDGFSGNLATWAAIERMSDAELNELAWELNIAWYEPSASTAVKREIIKNSDRVQQKLGTKWAVENVIETYFGDGNVLEWFEYEGTPGHFKINSSNPSVTNENLTKFLRILSKVKRGSAQLDGIFINMLSQQDIRTGVACHIVDKMTIDLGRR
ncbi:phage tail protein I [Clostridiales Family XIII bacterium ASD5510]|uniref:Phage tail protein I n=1 Tax=Hominibacterium faecale TaxID=2839743 RepID=A0A9J6QRR7_9FIRM|nr:phage tail protein I [Hominibacterium faecale]MCU7378116.1 phage tail protein I [Hominibacterium faecale]